MNERELKVIEKYKKLGYKCLHNRGLPDIIFFKTSPQEESDQPLPSHTIPPEASTTHPSSSHPTPIQHNPSHPIPNQPKTNRTTSFQAMPNYTNPIHPIHDIVFVEVKSPKDKLKYEQHIFKIIAEVLGLNYKIEVIE